MKTYNCYKCGLPIVFRSCVRHKDTNQLIRPHGAKAIPIHIGGRCGQTFMPFLLTG